MGNETAKPGFTLIELALAVLIVGILVSLAAVRFSGVANAAKLRAAEADLSTIRDSIVGTATFPGYLGDMGAIPGFSPGLLRIGNLLCPTNLFGIGDVRSDRYGIPAAGCAPASAFTSWDAEAGRGWRGPYISASSCIMSVSGDTHLFPRRDDRRFPGDSTFGDRGFYPAATHVSLPADYRASDDLHSAFGFAGEPAIGDPWGNPYILQIPPPQAFDNPSAVSARTRFRYARIVSAGPDGVLSTPCFPSSAATWDADSRRSSRLAGRDENGATARGDDLVLFLNRNDLYEEDEGHEP